MPKTEINTAVIVGVIQYIIIKVILQNKSKKAKKRKFNAV